MLKTEIIKSGSIYQSYAHMRHGPFFSDSRYILQTRYVIKYGDAKHITLTTNKKKLSCRRETMQRFVSRNIFAKSLR